MKIKNNEVKDIEIKNNISIKELTNKMRFSGFQATNLANGVNLIKGMKNNNTLIFLGFTSNMVASGLRGAFVDLIKKGYVDVIVTAGGSIDHDVIRSFKPYHLGDFYMDDVKLHKKNINRLGNILIPDSRYKLFESYMQKILEKIYKKQKVLSPRELIEYIGKEIKDKNSILYQCRKHKVPIFCPGITDSALGLQLFFFKQEYKDFVIDVTKDMHELFDLVFSKKKTGAIILGGGLPKHYILGVNLLHGGLDYSLYITTATPYDGSLSGAMPQEAKSWGKIAEVGRTATIYSDASIVFPLIVASL